MGQFALVRGRALRVTKLDGCGSVALGPDSVVVTEGFISVGLTANNEEGEAISVTNAAGRVCILDEPPPTFTGYSVEVAYCGVDPDLFALMTGQSVIRDEAGEAVGVGIDSDVETDKSGFAMELWSNVPVAACDPSGEASYGYFLVPFVKGGTLGDVTVENGAVNFTLTGAQTKDGNEWGKGDYEVVRDGSGAPGPLLEDIPSTRHLHLQLTTVPPPTFTDGAEELGSPATTAAAGSPATLSPADGYPPENIADATDFDSATPGAWTAGDYVRFRDGSVGHWDGTQWVSGVA